MSEAILHPYSFAGDALAMSCSLEGIEAETTASGNLLLSDELAEDSDLTIATEVRMALGTIDRVLPEHERVEPPVSIFVLVRSPSSRLRTSHRLAGEMGTFSGAIELGSDVLHSRLTLTPILARTTSSPVIFEGFAAHRGAILATGRPIDILLEEPPTPPGGYLEIQFEDFRTSPDPLRKRNAGCMYAIDTQGDFPRLWLNNAIPGFEQVVRSKARRGIPRRIRDATYDTICSQVWTALISASVGELAIALEDGLQEQEALASIPEWEQRVLQFWSSRIYPELSNSDQALAEVCAVSAREGHGTELQERISLAVQAWVNSADAFGGLMRFVTGEGV